MKKSYNAFLNFRRELLERNHRCASCPAAFKKIAHLKAHSLRHTGEKPFKCATCDKYVYFRCLITPFENSQRWMGQNTFPILLLNDDNMIGEH